MNNPYHGKYLERPTPKFQHNHRVWFIDEKTGVVMEGLFIRSFISSDDTPALADVMVTNQQGVESQIRLPESVLFSTENEAYGLAATHIDKLVRTARSQIDVLEEAFEKVSKKIQSFNANSTTQAASTVAEDSE